MAVNLNDREPFGGSAVEHGRNIVRRPSNPHRSPFRTMLVRDAVNFAHDEPLAAVACAVAAQKDRYGFVTVAGEEETLQVLVLVAREGQSDGSGHFSNS